MKLQDAYIAESGTGIGNWKMIGYNMVSSSNFKYMENDKEDPTNGATASSVELTAGLEKGWQAQAKAALNDCEINSQWRLDVGANTSKGGSATYTVSVTGGNGGDCDILAPSMGKLSTATSNVIQTL